MGGADPCKNCGREYPLSTAAYEFAMRDDDGECFPTCFTCGKHIGRHDEPRAHTREECYKSHCDNCCGDPTTYDEHGCCADCAPGDVAVPVAEGVVAGAPTAADDDAADAAVGGAWVSSWRRYPLPPRPSERSVYPCITAAIQG